MKTWVWRILIQDFNFHYVTVIKSPHSSHWGHFIVFAPKEEVSLHPSDSIEWSGDIDDVLCALPIIFDREKEHPFDKDEFTLEDLLLYELKVRNDAYFDDSYWIENGGWRSHYRYKNK